MSVIMNTITSHTTRTHQPNPGNWHNWSGLQQASPAQFVQPDTIEELIQTVLRSSKCRVVGAGHSFSPLVCTGDTLISLDSLTGLIRHNAQQCQSTLYAGTRLYHLDQYLQPLNQALINQGDIDQQSLAGAVATGTHGTGQQLSCLSALVTGFELLGANGDILWCDAHQNSPIFRAGRVALGSFGILTKISLQNMPRYQLREEVYLQPLTDILGNMSHWKHEHRHIESFVFIHADQAMVKTLNPCTDALRPRQAAWPSDDALLTWCSELTRKFPAINPYLQKLLGVLVKPSSCVDWSSKIFPTPRNTRFNEMEYQIPAEQGPACLEEVVYSLRKHKVPMFFPLEYRYVKADDIWLSPFYQRDSASISVHQYHKQDCQQIFRLVEPIFQKYQGRPHWGKMHNLTARQLRELYPHWTDFMALRAELDPQQKWLNPYLQQLFGV